jgi:hypothetical protein
MVASSGPVPVLNNGIGGRIVGGEDAVRGEYFLDNDILLKSYLIFILKN